jgi:hypothetical protein
MKLFQFLLNRKEDEKMFLVMVDLKDSKYALERNIIFFSPKDNNFIWVKALQSI